MIARKNASSDHPIRRATAFGFLDQDRGRNRNRKDGRAIVHKQFDGYRACIGFNGVNRIGTDTDTDSDPDAENGIFQMRLS